MERLAMETKNITNENIQKILELFPNVATEGVNDNGEIVRAIDFEKLKQELSEVVIDGEESYDFTWVGKKEAMVEANRPIRKTLRPDRESSVDWENTENIYIEGDNLEALKLLQESYLGKVKMIYIDPPYNTGNDFVYRDNFTQDKESYEDELGVNDEEGNRLFQNTESNGRFHSDWCSMVYSRLKLARNLLTNDGVVFISIDDNEQASLKNLCDMVFGEENFVECLIWKKRATPPNDRNIGRIHEFILIYAKNISSICLGLLPRDTKSIERYSNPDNDFRGPWVASDLSANGKGGRIVQSCIYPIHNPYNNKEYLPSEGRCWLFNKEKMDLYIKEGRIGFREQTGAPYLKRFLSEVRQGLTLPTMLTEFGYSSTSASEIDGLFEKKGIFEYAKPTTLINPLIRVGCPNPNDIILDFFSGSATTAHAVMQLNAEDGGNRKFIMVQLPEKTDEKSEAYKAGYPNICEIGKERIRRAGKKIQEENPDKKIDIGFRVFKVDDTNMKNVYYTPTEMKQTQLGMFESNIKEDRTDEDLLYGVLLDWGVELSLPHRVEVIDGKRVHIVADDVLVACFEDNIPESVIHKIAEKKPMRVVFRDSSFNRDANKINVEEIFKLKTPDTTVKVI